MLSGSTVQTFHHGLTHRRAQLVANTASAVRQPGAAAAGVPAVAHLPASAAERHVITAARGRSAVLYGMTTRPRLTRRHTHTARSGHRKRRRTSQHLRR